jgi:ubiquinone/menaquinone biosynthesis C-methylase UbiE
MHIDELAKYRCPRTGSALTLMGAADEHGSVESGRLVSAEGVQYPIECGVPNFVDAGALSPIEASTQAEYDRVAERIYDVAVDWQFASMYEDEDRVRESMVDLLNLQRNANILEVGCGTGRDSFRLAQRVGADGLLHMQDLSRGMVRTCRAKMAERARGGGILCRLEYSVSNATSLPFPDGVFDAVFHFGGFNQFGDLKRGASELARVARLGGRVVFGDEAVAPWLKGTEFDAIVTTNNALFKAEAPLAALPLGARDVTVRWIIGNCFYVIAFTKGDGPPPLNLDLPHQGWRGGTMRTRYFGALEGVTPDAKAMAKEAAAKAGLSVHEWLDRVIRAEASRPPRGGDS